MNIYLLTQNTVTGWDTYDSCVVLADTENEAAKVYHEVTNGMMSYGTYYAKDVINECYEQNKKMWEDIYKSDIEDILKKYEKSGKRKDLTSDIREYFKNQEI